MRKYLALAAIAVLFACSPEKQNTETTSRSVYQTSSKLRVKNNLKEPATLVSFGVIFAKELFVSTPNSDSTVVLAADDFVPEQVGVLILGIHTLKGNKYYTTDPMQLPAGATLALTLNEPMEKSEISISSGATDLQNREFVYKFNLVESFTVTK